MQVLATLVLLALGAPGQDPVVYMGRAFVFEADLVRARARGWIGAEANDEEVLDGVRAALERRLRLLGRFAEATVRREEGGRFAAVFVGDQPEVIETMLVAGLSDPGRLELRLLATEGELAAAGTSREVERERLTKWRAANPGASLAAFDAVPRESGGPAGPLVWRAQRGADEAVAVLGDVLATVLREDLERGLRVQPGEDPTSALSFSLNEERATAFAQRVKPYGGRTVVVLLNDVVVATREIAEPFEFPLSAGAGYTLDEVRVLLMSVGVPLDVPLAFVERAKRELDNVKRRKPAPSKGD